MTTKNDHRLQSTSIQRTPILTANEMNFDVFSHIFKDSILQIQEIKEDADRILKNAYENYVDSNLLQFYNENVQ